MLAFIVSACNNSNRAKFNFFAKRADSLNLVFDNLPPQIPRMQAVADSLEMTIDSMQKYYDKMYPGEKTVFKKKSRHR